MRAQLANLNEGTPEWIELNSKIGEMEGKVSTMKAQKDELDRGIEGLNQARNGVSIDKKSMQQDKSEMQAAQNEMASACMRNMLIACVVLMPSSEKSFAESSLVCLSMRTVTLTVSMRTSLSYVRYTAIVRVAGGIFLGFVMARRKSITCRLEIAVTRFLAQ